VTPTDRKLRREFDVRPADKNGAEPGDIVWIEEAGSELSRRAKVIERIGPMSDPRTISLISIATKRHPGRVPRGRGARGRARQGAPIGDRLDLRQVPLVTIDGEDARDFDDASMPSATTPIPGGWRLLVAIADVALVRPARQATRPRRLPPRHFGLLPRPGRSNAARAALEQLVFAAATPGPAGAWWPRCGSTLTARSRNTASTAP
jgi:hypothetical protein